MGRCPTKAADSPFRKARMDAAKTNEKLLSKDGAAEYLGISVSTLSDYELGYTKVVPPDMVIKMADLYNSPELENYYCTHMCPLGRGMAVADVADIDRITVKALSSFRRLGETKELLLDIAENGLVDDSDIEDMNCILKNLDEIERVIQSLKLWARKNM